MPPKQIAPKLLSWASEIDDQTVAQAQRTSRLPIIEGHVALMPDAHLGKGSTVGSVIPTTGAVIPAAVGVDLGCGVVAVETDLRQHDLPDNLDPLLREVERRIPAGVGRGHDRRSESADRWLAEHDPRKWRREGFSTRQESRAAKQFGTLGAGNHWTEVLVDERGVVWAGLHSGSRGIGNELATQHIEKAKAFAREASTPLEDPDLAYFVQGTPEFDAYIADMLWAQDYARANREQMMDALLDALFRQIGRGREVSRINCHHNYTIRERHQGRDLWITRKGAIRARRGELGVLPGSMGTGTFIVRGLGGEGSFDSSAHGAGRRFSRNQAKKRFTVDQLEEWMAGKTWNRDRARALLDEIPNAYKPVDQVIKDQSDLAAVVHTLHQVLNYKGS